MVQIVQRVSREGGERLRERGLSAAQFEVLMQVYQKPGLVQQDLAERLGVTKGNVSQLLGKLEGDGLLARTAQGAAFALELTPTGRQLIDEMLPEYRSFVRSQFAQLSPEELEQFHLLLQKIG
ncbi:MAG: MarR family transcriptional regulator [Meiothermus sp.]|nr:MarR family transcriptional regulator [Meiothermus sp.]